MKKKNGFTLVELLAVIVVLALIMVIAIPAVLKVMNDARRKAFALYINKSVNAVQTHYLYESAQGSIAGAGIYVYDITEDLDLESTGSYSGYVVVDATNVDDPNYYVFIHDANYMIFNYNVTTSKMPEADNAAIQTYEATSFNSNFGNAYLSCQKVRENYNGQTITDVNGQTVNYEAPACKNPDGFIIVEQN